MATRFGSDEEKHPSRVLLFKLTEKVFIYSSFFLLNFYKIRLCDAEDAGDIIDKFEKLVCGRFVWGKVFLFMEALQRVVEEHTKPLVGHT